MRNASSPSCPTPPRSPKPRRITSSRSSTRRSRERDFAHVALAGGSTPRAVNALLAAPPRRTALDWDRVVFWFGDERCVPPADNESNYRMNRETLLDPLKIRAAHVHRMRGEDDPSAAAADYDAVLQRELGDTPRLDLILLGMGPDGHTASLFPGTITAIDNDKHCIAHYVPQLDTWRITLTPRTINAARNVAITAGGARESRRAPRRPRRPEADRRLPRPARPPGRRRAALVRRRRRQHSKLAILDDRAARRLRSSRFGGDAFGVGG